MPSPSAVFRRFIQGVNFLQIGISKQWHIGFKAYKPEPFDG